jgi:sugar phosphate isomerase/epimerase
VRCGISTACFYPGQTLDSLKKVAEANASVTEIFLNTFSELEDGYVGKLADVVKASGVEVAAVHPCSSAMDGFFFATDYEGRMRDGIKLYRRFFEAARALGAGKLVFHGDHRPNMQKFGARRYAESFKALAAVGREYGILLCHENVSYCRLGDPADVRELRPFLGQDAAFVLDTKQVQRFGAGLPDMLDAMGGCIRHVHISDYSVGHDCLPPGAGEADFALLIGKLKAQQYDGDLVIELYRDNFEDVQDLVKAMQYVQRLLP